MRRALTLTLGLLGGCASERAPLPDAALLTRLSIDLRGVRPTVAELDALDDPGALDAMVDAFLLDPRFETRVRDLFAPIWGTRIDSYPLSAEELGLDDDVAFQRSVGEAPLRLLGRVAATDRPWTDIVTADWTMVDGALAAAWPVAPAPPSGWAEARWTDGRPAVGVLASNTVWWRWPSNGDNHHRGRANQITRALVCQDLLERDVSFPPDLDLTDPATVADALRENEACASCHVTLDPIASALFGFSHARPEPSELLTYHPEREHGWAAATGVAPAWYGTPVPSLAALGREIAADPRFVTCAVEQVWTGLLGRAPTEADRDALTAHREDFLDGGLALRALVRSVVASPRYRSAEDGAAPRHLMTPTLLASVVEDLTGFRWTIGGVDLLETDRIGLRSLAGGPDGRGGGGQADAPTPTSVLVQRRLAELAAAYAVERDDGALFPAGFVAPDGAAATEQVRQLHARVLGARPEADDVRVAASLALVAEVDGGGPDGWGALLTALLSDPEQVLY